MKLRPLLLCALAYVVMTFPVAVIWHITLFEDLYRSLGYFEGEPSFALGFAAIASQALILAAVYPRFHDAERPLRAGLLFAPAAGSLPLDRVGVGVLRQGERAGGRLPPH